MKQFAVMHPAIQMAMHEAVKNSPLTRLIEQASNPYHQVHLARSFQIKAPKTSPISQVAAVSNNPWLSMKTRKK